MACNVILHGRQRKVLVFSEMRLCLCDSVFGGPRDPFISPMCLQNAVPLVDTPHRPKALPRTTATLAFAARNRRRPLPRIRQLPA